MAIKPILFNTEMVQAILDGRKGCTRRVVKPQPKARLCYTYAGHIQTGEHTNFGAKNISFRKI